MKGFSKISAKITALSLLLWLALRNLQTSIFAVNESGGGGGVGGGGTPTINGTNLAQLGDIFGRVVSVLIGIAGAIGIILIVIGGIRYILSSGDPKAMQSARNALTFAIIGLIIILLALAIVLLIGNVLGANNGNGQPLNVIHIGT